MNDMGVSWALPIEWSLRWLVLALALALWMRFLRGSPAAWRVTSMRMAWTIGWLLPFLPAVGTGWLDAGSSRTSEVAWDRGTYSQAEVRTFVAPKTLEGEPVTNSLRSLATPSPIPPTKTSRDVEVPGDTAWQSLVQRTCAIAWVAGVLLCASRLLVGTLRLRRLARDGAEVPDGEQTDFDEIRESLGIRRSVRLVMHEHQPVPIVLPFLRPVLVLPVSFSKRSVEERHAVYRHELAHVMRGDARWNWLAHVSKVIFFFHPGVRWMAHCMRRDVERACDEFVLSLGTEPRAYAHVLVDFAKELPMASRDVSLASGFPSGDALGVRVRAILSYSPGAKTVPRWRRSLSFLMGVTLLTTVSSARWLRAASAVERDVESRVMVPPDASLPERGSASLSMRSEGEPVEVRVVNDERKPIHDAEVFLQLNGTLVPVGRTDRKGCVRVALPSREGQCISGTFELRHSDHETRTFVLGPGVRSVEIEVGRTTAKRDPHGLPEDVAELARQSGLDATAVAAAYRANRVVGWQRPPEERDEVLRVLREQGANGFRAMRFLLQIGQTNGGSDQVLAATVTEDLVDDLLELASGPPLPRWGSWSVLRSLAKVDDARSRTYVRERLARERDPGCFMSLAQAAAELGIPECREVIARQVLAGEAGWHGVQRFLVGALGRYGTEAVPTLRTLLRQQGRSALLPTLVVLQLIDLDAAREEAARIREEAWFAELSPFEKEVVAKLL